MVNHYFLHSFQAGNLDEAFKHSFELIKQSPDLESALKNSGVFQQLNQGLEENIRLFPMLVRNLFLAPKHNVSLSRQESPILELLSLESQLNLLQIQSLGLMRHGPAYSLLGDHFLTELKFDNPYLPAGAWLIYKLKNQLHVHPMNQELKQVFESVEEGISFDLIPENTLRSALGLGILFKNEQNK